MAEAFSPAALQVKTPDSFKTISDALSFIGKAQEVGKAQQINPLDVQRAQQDTRTKEMELGKAEQAYKEFNAVRDRMTNQDNFMTDGMFDLAKARKSIMDVAPTTGPAWIEKIASVHKAQSEAERAKLTLTNEERAPSAGMLGALGYAGVQDPAIIKKALDVLDQQYKDNPGVLKLHNAIRGIFDNATAGEHVPKTALLLSQSLFSPTEQNTAFAPKTSQQDVGGRSQQIITQPSVLGAQPKSFEGAFNVQKTLPPTTEEVTDTGKSFFIGPKEGATTTPRQLPDLSGVKDLHPNVTPDLISRMETVESGGNPLAVSAKGAMGPLQFMPGTAARLQKEYGPFNPFNPVEARKAAAFEMSRLMKKYNGDTKLALAAYNAGEGAVDKAGGVPNFPETQNYVKSIEGANSRVQSKAPPGVMQNVEGTTGIINKHFADLTANMATAPLLEGIAQNIKMYADKAVTGTGQDKLAFINGIFAQLGVPRSNDLKTATDDLEKNMAQLAKASPAATDAARTINELANPHVTMTKEAIKDSADQIIGQLRMSKSAYGHFLPHQLSGDRERYTKEIENFPGDARVWQYASLDAAGRARMKEKMRKEDWPSFKAKLDKAEQLGLVK